jgi:hypothetical protein
MHMLAPNRVVRLMLAGVAAAIAACATPPSHQPPQQPQLTSAVAPPPRLRPPDHLLGTAREILRGRMASHSNDMRELMSAIMILDYPRIDDRATAIAGDVSLARPLTGDATELASALPEKFFLYQDELRLAAKTLAEAASRQHAFDVADAYGHVSQVCVRCHASYRAGR